MDEERFYLDTSNMDSVIAKVQEIAGTMQKIRENYQQQVYRLSEHWEGEGRVAFDKRSAQLLRVLTDVSQSFYDIGEDLLTASTAYMDADTQLAKISDGKTERF